MNSYELPKSDRKGIEELFKIYNKNGPGYQLAISINHNLVFLQVCGKANLEYNIDMDCSTLIEAGSVSKQFTAAAILLLEQQGKLSLDDKIKKFFPELPDIGLEIKHLLYHTSGLRDWGSIATLTGWPRGTKAFTNEDVIEIINRQRSVNNIPNEEFVYSNSNYNLLAVIVERAGGSSLASYTYKNIFTPAEMSNTIWRNNHYKSRFSQAMSYRKSENNYHLDIFNEYAYGNCGLLTTANDLLKWNHYFLSGRFGTPSLRDKQLTLTKLNNGSINVYSAGLYTRNKNGLSIICHSGATGSFRSFLESFPEKNISIAWLSNTSEFDNEINEILGKVEDILINTANESQNSSKERLRSPTVKDATKIGEIIIFENQIDFLCSPYKANIHSRELDYKLGDNITQEKSQPDSEKYLGEYFSIDTQSFLKITSGEKSLVMYLRPYKQYTMIPDTTDKFLLPGLSGELLFFRNESNDNKIDRLLISIPRARNIEFLKLPMTLS